MGDKEYDSRRYGVLDSSLNKGYVTHTLVKLKTITTNMVKKNVSSILSKELLEGIR